MSVRSHDAVVHHGRRNLPGTQNAKLFGFAIEEKFHDMQGQFACQEFIQAMIRKDHTDVAAICKVPDPQNAAVWTLEHLRQILTELNLLCVMLDEACTAATCPKMIATKDWEFLCAAHPKPRDCCAVDYIVHTLNGFTAMLNSPDLFPSRAKVPSQSTQFFVSITRRLYRVFAHAYYHHRAEFDKFEKATSLCARFKHFATTYGLMTSRMFTPPIDL